jgi:hypothetical protein
MTTSAHHPYSLPVTAAAPRFAAWMAAAFTAVFALAATTASLLAANLPAVVVAQIGTSSITAPPGIKTTAAPTRASTTAPIAPVLATSPEAKPLWKDLTLDQQQSLKPLAANWSTINEPQKRKWLALSKNFPSKTSAEQAKLHGRMTEWVSLSQQQRTQARLNFAEAKNLPAHERAAQWEAYQALSAQEKQKLAAARGSPSPTGATNAVKPVPEQKLAKVPATRHTHLTGTMAAHNPKVDANTLLPLAPSADAATAHKN